MIGRRSVEVIANRIWPNTTTLGGLELFDRVRLWYCALAALVLASVILMLDVGGRPDPSGPARVLYGTWYFHPGDDMRWADPRASETGWDRFLLASSPQTRDDDVGLPGLLDGWRARGHSDLEGYGWYRLHMTLPRVPDLALLGPTMVDDGYQMFWNGRLIGGIGRLGEHPRVIASRPFLVRLPASHKGEAGVLAIRTYMQPGFGRGEQSGGLRSAPTLATGPFADRLHAAQWNRTIAGYIVEIALPWMMFVLAVIALLVAPRIPRPAFAHWLSIALTATACLRLGNAIAAWTDLLDVSALVWLNAILLSPLTMLAWTLAWNLWTDGRDRQFVFFGAIAAWVVRVAGAVGHADALTSAARVVSLVLFAIIALRIIRRGEHRWLALSAMLPVTVALFISEVKRLGIPDIWFPFNIGVTLTQYAYALALPLLCFAVTADGRKLVASTDVDEGRLGLSPEAG